MIHYTYKKPRILFVGINPHFGSFDRGVPFSNNKMFWYLLVCFIGRVAYEKYIGSKDFSFGWQEPINKSRVFVMHFPLRGEAIVRIRELRDLCAYIAQDRYHRVRLRADRESQTVT